MKAKLEWVIQEPPKTPANINQSLDIDFKTLYSIYNDTLIDKEYYKYIQGKRVILVGPSSYLRGKNRGEFIDSFDIIVRLNKSFPVNPSDYNDLGKLTHIRYHNACMRENEGGPLHLDNPQSLQLKYISSIFPKHLDYFDRDIKLIESNLVNSNVNLHCFADIEQYLTFHSIMETRPNVGTAAILDLINYDPKQLHISGLSFFKENYIDSYEGRRPEIPSEYQNNKVNNHAQGPQRDIIKLLSDNLPFITLDSEVEKFLL